MKTKWDELCQLVDRHDNWNEHQALEMWMQRVRESGMKSRISLYVFFHMERGLDLFHAMDSAMQDIGM